VSLPCDNRVHHPNPRSTFSKVGSTVTLYSKCTKIVFFENAQCRPSTKPNTCTRHTHSHTHTRTRARAHTHTQSSLSLSLKPKKPSPVPVAPQSNSAVSGLGFRVYFALAPTSKAFFPLPKCVHVSTIYMNKYGRCAQVYKYKCTGQYGMCPSLSAALHALCIYVFDFFNYTHTYIYSRKYVTCPSLSAALHALGIFFF